MWYRVLALSMVAGLVLLFTGAGLAEERAKKERNKGARAADVKEFHGKIVHVDVGKRLLVIAEHEKGGPGGKGPGAVRPGGGEEERQQGDDEEQERKERAKGTAAKAGPGAGQHHGHHAFHVGEKAEIKLDGKDASLSQLKEGQHAVVWAHPRHEGARPGGKGPGAAKSGGGEEERQQGDNEEQERKERAKGATGAGAQHHEPPHLVAVRIHAHSEGHHPGTTGGGAAPIRP